MANSLFRWITNNIKWKIIISNIFCILYSFSLILLFFVLVKHVYVYLCISWLAEKKCAIHRFSYRKKHYFAPLWKMQRLWIIVLNATRELSWKSQEDFILQKVQNNQRKCHWNLRASAVWRLARNTFEKCVRNVNSSIIFRRIAAPSRVVALTLECGGWSATPMSRSSDGWRCAMDPRVRQSRK